MYGALLLKDRTSSERTYPYRIENRYEQRSGSLGARAFDGGWLFGASFDFPVGGVELGFSARMSFGFFSVVDIVGSPANRAISLALTAAL